MKVKLFYNFFFVIFEHSKMLYMYAPTAMEKRALQTGLTAFIITDNTQTVDSQQEKDIARRVAEQRPNRQYSESRYEQPDSVCSRNESGLKYKIGLYMVIFTLDKTHVYSLNTHFQNSFLGVKLKIQPTRLK